MLSKHLLICAALGGAFSSPLRAQAPNAVQNQPAQSGYELLVEAKKKVSADYSIYDKISPEEKLKRERVVAARNAPALALLREALRAGISVPLAKTYDDTTNFKLYAGTRELPRQLSIESDVRLADSDFVGALGSKLDAQELAVQFGRGPLLTAFVGNAVESIGRTDFSQVAAHLDAPQCRAAAARLGAIEVKRPSFAEVLRAESEQTQTLLVSILPAVQKETQNPEIRKANDYSPEQVAQIAALTPEKLRADTTALFAPVIQHAAQPYAPALLLLPPTPDPLLEDSRSLLAQTKMRFAFTRGRAFNLLLKSALELRAQKLEGGSFPNVFQTPADPFSPDAEPLVYRKTKAGYLLYSVGPDGRDNGGADIQTIEVGELNGVKSVTDKLRSDSFGDIIQKPF